MSNRQKRFILPEDEIPKYWYNIQADMVNKPMPPLNPATKEPLKPEDLYPIFAKELCHQELNQTDAWIEIPEEVREMYKYYRSTPLVRAYGLEKALGTPAHIYFKNESVSPIGSHKLNSALAQAYYCKKEGVTNITTETMGSCFVVCRQGVRTGSCRISGKNQLRTEALPPQHHADLRRTGNSFSFHVYPCRKKYPDQISEPSGFTGYCHLGSYRTGTHHTEL